MTQPRPNLTLSWAEGMHGVPREAWNALSGHEAFPFLEWDWLALTEESGSACGGTGWLPRHLLAWRGERLVGGVPLYVKGHSAGEFIFDHVWAHDTDTNPDCVKWYVWRVRAKIEQNPRDPRFILTERGVGYRFALT